MLLLVRRSALYLIAAALLSSSVLATLIPIATANAATFADENPQTQLERWLFYRGMRACLDDADFNGTSGTDNKTISVSDINKGQLSLQEGRGFGYIAPSLEDGVTTGAPSKGVDTDGTISCDDGSIWVRGATLFGFDNTLGLVCAMNRALDSGNLSKKDGGRIQPDKDGGPGQENCEASREVYFDGGDNIFQEALTWALENEGSKQRPPATLSENNGPEYTSGALKYLIGWRSLINFCGSMGGSLDDTLFETENFDGNKVVSARYVTSDGTIDPRHGFTIGGKDENKWWDDEERNASSVISDIWYDGATAKDAREMKCDTMAQWSRDNAQAYADWAAKNQDAAEENESTSGTVDDTSTGTGSQTTTCDIDGVGWMICPVVRTIAAFNDSLFSLLESLLNIDASMFDTEGGGKAVFQSWQAMRDIANVAFVIAFMVIVYSQLTSVGISNYGIKKMLPRIVVAAILVNLSYFICAVGVDISNILGSSLHDLMISQTKELGDETGANLGQWDKITTWLIAGGVGSLAIGGAALTVGTYGFLGALALLIPLAVVALVAALTVVFVLVARQALVIILIVLSPLAFVAFLLPNTEAWFSRWRKTFFSMLLIYPLVALLFGGSQLASAVIRGGADDALVYILSLIVLVMPLFATPLLLKFSGGLIGRFAGVVNNPNKGMFDRMKKGGEQFRKNQENRRAIGALGSNGPMLGKRRFRRKARNDAIDASLQRERQSQSNQYVAGASMDQNGDATTFGKKLAGGGPILGGGADPAAIQRALSNAQITIDEAVAKDVKAESVMVRNMDASSLKDILSDPASSDARQAAAMQRLVKISDPGGPDGYESEVNTALSGSSDIVRRATAEALAADGPGFLKASDIDRFATGSHTNATTGATSTLQEVASANIEQGAYSQEKMVADTPGNLQYAFDSANLAGKQRMVDTAAALKANDNLRGSIKHNAQSIDNLSRAVRP